jgi:hypothetical protein
MTFAVSVDPSITGFAGSIPGAFVNDRVGPLQATGKRLSELLDMIVTSSKGGLWIAYGSSVTQSKPPKEQFWVVLPYTMALEDLFRLVGQLAVTPGR